MDALHRVRHVWPQDPPAYVARRHNRKTLFKLIRRSHILFQARKGQLRLNRSIDTKDMLGEPSTLLSTKRVFTPSLTLLQVAQCRDNYSLDAVHVSEHARTRAQSVHLCVLEAVHALRAQSWTQRPMHVSVPNSVPQDGPASTVTEPRLKMERATNPTHAPPGKQCDHRCLDHPDSWWR